jgi:hypothetical protein
MKTVPFLTLIAIAASAGISIAGESERPVSYESSTYDYGYASTRFRSAGMEGAYYRSNVMRNAVIFRNDTPNFVSFFVYFGDNAGPNSVNDMLRSDAFVYEQVVPPYQTSFVDQKGRFLWVGSKVGRWTVGHAGVVALPR